MIKNCGDKEHIFYEYGKEPATFVDDLPVKPLNRMKVGLTKVLRDSASLMHHKFSQQFFPDTLARIE